MTEAEKRNAAKKFVQDWSGKGDEKQDTQRFWIQLLREVMGVDEPESYISFELPVKLDHTSFIDAYIETTRVLIEQKGREISLKNGYRQSDGSVLTPFQQARRYAGYLSHDKNPRWIVVCNFQEFQIHDMNRPNDPPELIRLADLEKEFYRLQFLVDTGNENIKKEMEISLQAGEIVGVLYDALLKKYKDPSNPDTLKSLNALCVRLVFCLYAEDAGIFNSSRNLFHDYMQAHRAEDRRALINLFRILDQKPEERDAYLDDDLAAFPYVNGGLFADENIEIPRLGEEIIDLILRRASADFDWSAISPTIFGAVFESTLNPETRRSGGMHYTSVENIHKVIDPLFLNDLKAELEEIKAVSVSRTRDQRLRTFQAKLASLTFLDPACGSGNFLTETYLSLRRLENEVIALLNRDQIVMDLTNPIRVSISQFYGIEINDFAVTVARTALWIAESQMMKETEDVVQTNLDFLPLKANANIVEGNALRIDWESVVDKSKLNYIMGNPPFVGGMFTTKSQKKDMANAFHNKKGIGELDYVSSWYVKASEFITGTRVKCAYVSTNSICQGQQAVLLWKELFEKGISIDFAYHTFRWDSEAMIKAHVHCIIVGFSSQRESKCFIYDQSGTRQVSNINAYLIDAPKIFIENRASPLSNVPKMRFGSMPRDGGGFILSDDEKERLIKEEPLSQKWVRQYTGSNEYINGKTRWCLWLVNANPSDLRKCPTVMSRVESVRQFRLNSVAASTRKFADTPTLFCQIAQPETDYIIVPSVSSERRRYIPMGFLEKSVITSNLAFLIPNATMYHFGILTSNVHMAWMRTVAGRLEMRYRYSKDIVYNNFPWPTPTADQKARIEQTAQAILDARALYPDCSLADLYDEVTMPPELRKAHQANDKAVMQAYGFWGKLNSEPECVAELMKMHQELTAKEKK